MIFQFNLNNVYTISPPLKLNISRKSADVISCKNNIDRYKKLFYNEHIEKTFS